MLRKVIEDLLADAFMRLTWMTGYYHSGFITGMDRVFKNTPFLWDRIEDGSDLRIFKEFKWLSYDPNHYKHR